MKFKVTITEILKRTVTIEAETAEEAKAKVSHSYWSGDEVLDVNDYEGTYFETEEA